MPLQNRVTPEGEIIATAARGSLMGNRGGAIHRSDRTLTSRRWVSKRWIACRLEFKGRHREVMTPGRYTELFFLDEATALAAGHRPCFECRRVDAKRFAALWAEMAGLARVPRADEIDEMLHAQRLGASRSKTVHAAAFASLPTGAFVRLPSGPHLVRSGEVVPWRVDGYRPALARRPARNDTFDVLTPAMIVSVLAAGYRLGLHPSAAREHTSGTDR